MFCFSTGQNQQNQELGADASETVGEEKSFLLKLLDFVCLFVCFHIDAKAGQHTNKYSVPKAKKVFNIPPPELIFVCSVR